MVVKKGESPKFKGYEVSQDYEKLYDFVNNGMEIVGWLKNNRISEDGEYDFYDSCSIKTLKDKFVPKGKYLIGYRGYGCESFEQSKESFINDCKWCNLYYVPPSEK